MDPMGCASLALEHHALQVPVVERTTRDLSWSVVPRVARTIVASQIMKGSLVVRKFNLGLEENTVLRMVMLLSAAAGAPLNMTDGLCAAQNLPVECRPYLAQTPCQLAERPLAVYHFVH